MFHLVRLQRSPVQLKIQSFKSLYIFSNLHFCHLSYSGLTSNNEFGMASALESINLQFPALTGSGQPTHECLLYLPSIQRANEQRHKAAMDNPNEFASQPKADHDESNIKSSNHSFITPTASPSSYLRAMQTLPPRRESEISNQSRK